MDEQVVEDFLAQIEFVPDGFLSTVGLTVKQLAVQLLSEALETIRDEITHFQPETS